MSNIEKLSIAMTKEQITAIRMAVDCGEYATTSEVVRDAIRDWQAKRTPCQENIIRLRKLWDEGIASGSAGTISMTELRKEARARLKSAKNAEYHYS